jgi:putative transposase
MSRQTSRGKAPVNLMCETFHISRNAFYEAKKREATGIVIPLRRQASSRYASSETVLLAIRQVVAEHPAWGVRKVWATLRREHDLRVGKKRVYALMKAEGLIFERNRREDERLQGHVTTAEPNRRFATDITTVWTRRDGVVAVAPTVDCGCRSALGIVVSKSQDAPTILRSVSAALRLAFGSPDSVPEGVELRSDHGSQYTSDACEELVKTWHVQHTFSPKGRPTGNAVAERFIRTLKEEVIWLRDWESVDEVREAVEAWMLVYNTRRPHQAPDYATPSEHRAARLSTPIARVA